MGIVSLTTYSNYNSLGNDINIVGTFSGGEMQKYSDKHVSAPLMNYVEPYDYKGVQKTLFYTEVNTGISVGERVFIVNGNYDSAELIKIDKYKKGRDGYKVLYVDRCRIVLDIDYTGVRPNNGDIEVGDLMSDYLKIYYVDSYDVFMAANRQLTSRGGYLGGKFDYYQNNIAFIDTDYSPIDDGWTRTTGVTASPGFYVREPAYDPNLLKKTKGETWLNITDKLMSGSFSVASSQVNPTLAMRYFNNNKFMVVGKNITFNGVEYLAGTVYKWSSTLGWIPDVKEQGTANRAMISKTNFRQGMFTGTFYSGIYGSKDKKIDWTGDGVWLGGTLFNTSWKRGSMFSTITQEESYKTYVDRDRKPKQKLNTFNNGGYGWNYIIDSDFESTSIYSSIVRNTRFGMTPSLPVVENYLLSATQSFEKVLSDGLYESCEFNNTMLLNCTIKNSRSRNSLLSGVKHLNSWSKKSVIKDSTLIADSVIRIEGYDEWTASEKRGSSTYGMTFSNGVDFKIYKFYIGEADFNKLRNKDTFYIRGIKISNDSELLNIFDRKFTIGTWTEFIDGYNYSSEKIGNVDPNTFYKRGISCAAFLVNQEENEWTYGSIRYEKIQSPTFKVETAGFITDVLDENPNPRYSIDIYVSTQDIYRNNLSGINFNYSTQSTSSLTYNIPQKIANVIDIKDAFIIDADIDSGLIDNCNWNSGNNIGYNNDLTITGLTNSNNVPIYNVEFDRKTGEITATTLANSLNPEIKDRDSLGLSTDIKRGDVLFINGLDYYSKGKVIELTKLSSGSFYTDSIQATGLSYSGASSSTNGYDLKISWSTANAAVNTFTIESRGLDYKVGDVLYLRVDSLGSLHPTGTGVDAKFVVSKVDTTEPIRLPNSWTVQSLPPVMRLKPTYGKEIVMGLTESGIFTTYGQINRWASFGTTMISNSRIKSGIFRRTVLSNNSIKNEDYDATDKDFENISRIKSLVISDITFSNTGNNLSLATYNNSNFVGGTDEWVDGIIHRSVLKNMTFNKGIIRESTWLDGIFNGGTFYKNKSYDATPSQGLEFYYNNRIHSHYKSGATIGGLYNDRYSWRNGIFNGGEFVKSDWENGIFNDGHFYSSKWYNGVAKGGLFGNQETATTETAFYNGTVDYTTVANASFVASDTSKTGVTNSIVWNDGVFNGGVFGSNRTYLTSQAPPTVNSYSLAKSTKYVLGDTLITIDVTDNPKVISDLSLELDMSSSVNLSNIQILLLRPGSSAPMLVLDYDKVSANKILTTFHTDKTKLDIAKSSIPYSGVYRFSYSTPNDPNFVTDLAAFIGNTSVVGAWVIKIVSKASGLASVSIAAKLSLITYAEANSNYIESKAIWNNGNFNAGQFIDYGQWFGGQFNGGKFVSTKGWDSVSDVEDEGLASNYSWVNGTFNGGEFGNASKGANSTWYNGEFNGGIFSGRVWNSGIFKNGVFNGSGGNAYSGWITSTSSVANSVAVSDKSNAIDFVDNYNAGVYYGLWRNGLVTDRIEESLVSKKYFTKLQTNTENKSEKLKVDMNGILWRGGQFNHQSGLITNSVWLSGTFSNGVFTKGSFNPWVVRSGTSSFSEQAVWEKGTFNDGDFFYSEWKGGDFIYGTAFGMWFVDGTAYYMNAINVVWGATSTAPVWKNGNWDGSALDYAGSITNPMYSKILFKSAQRNQLLGMSGLSNGQGLLHIWNIFEDLSTLNTNLIGVRAGSIETFIANYTPNQTVYDQNKQNFIPPVVW